MSLQGTVCVKFTPKQYMKLYECGLLYLNSTNLNTDANVLGSLVEIALRQWLHIDTFKEITSALQPAPFHSECETN